MEISLSDQSWQVKGYWPYVPIKETSMELGQELKGTTNWLEARVPGGVHYDLYRAGCIPDPYFGQNSLLCEWVENRWWMYRTTFPMPEEARGRQVELCLKGLDYQVLIYCNDHLLGEHRGMYEPASYRITELLQEENTLVLVFQGVPREMGQIGYTSRTSTQKSRFNYKWDFSTHLVNIGPWQDVVLHILEPLRLKEPYLYTDYEGKQGKVCLEGALVDEKDHPLSDMPLWMEICPPDTKPQMVSVRTDERGRINAAITIDNPRLWYPAGYGEQPLYQIRLWDRENTELIFSHRAGIRRLELIANENAPGDALPYTFRINGRRIYVKGVNITPLDHLYGNVTKAQYRHLAALCVNANVNLIRVWGGGLIEKDWLYEACDEAGILIWQEFIQSSSGIDNKPNEDPDFLELLARNAKAALLGKRCFTSLAVWSGGNELTEEENRPCGYDNKNIAMLKNLVETFDKTRFFFPTSASGPREFLSLEKGVSHDVHGGWRYEGNPAHYLKYAESDHLFHSEFGSDGTPCLKTMKKFLGPEDLYPTPMSGNLTWQHHGEWWGTYYRDTELFGSITDLAEFTRLSQYVQAESLRFMIEADRRKKYHSSGSIIWQLNEPWPNASCTNLVDYYGECKPAYYWAAKAYGPLHVSLDYRNLCLPCQEETALGVYVHNSGERLGVKVTAEALDSQGHLLYEKCWEIDLPADSAVQAGHWQELWEYDSVIFLRLRIYARGELRDENVYVFGRKGPLLQGLRGLDARVEILDSRIQVLDSLSRENEACRCKIRLGNTGTQAAVLAGIELKEDCWWMWGRENYCFLFPGEEKELEFTLWKRNCGGFLEKYNPSGENNEGLPDFLVTWL